MPINRKRAGANLLIGTSAVMLVYVAYWLGGLLRTAKAAADAGQRITAGPMLVWVLALVPAAMVLLIVGVVMRTKSRSV
jgi:hypothetical protein